MSDLIPALMIGRARPKPIIDYVLDIFNGRELKTIVEIGGMRGSLEHDINNFSYPCCTDGHSSIIFAATGKDFYSVEISKQNVEIIKESCKNYPNAKILNMDGILFLNDLLSNFKLDLLFLDAWDVNLSDCAEKHLEAFKSAERCLHDNSLVLIDDTDVDIVDGVFVEKQGEWGGKGRLLIPYAITKGWHVVFTGRQTLLSRI